MEEYFIQTEQLTVGYDGKPLIKDIEIRLKKGEILTLIGPNGAGKSTILKSMTRQLKLVGGAVYLDGEMMSRMSGKDVAKRLAVVMTERIRPELMTWILWQQDVIHIREHWEFWEKKTGKRFMRQWNWFMRWILRTGILPPSVTARDRGFFLQELSARSRR